VFSTQISVFEAEFSTHEHSCAFIVMLHLTLSAVEPVSILVYFDLLLF